jgi:hypothetical protein
VNALTPEIYPWQATRALKAHNLRPAGLRAWVCDAVQGAGAVATLHKGDVVLGVSLTDKGEATAAVLRASAKRGATILTIVAGAAPAGKTMLVCPSEDGLGAVGFAAIADGLRWALSAGAKTVARE